MEEEKKIEEAKVTDEKIISPETKESEPESDFADEVKNEEPVAPETKEETKEEEKEPNPEINLYKEEEDLVTEEAPSNPHDKKKGPITYEYSDENLANVENARKDFNQAYKKSNIVKWIVTMGALTLIVLGYVIPNCCAPFKGQTYAMYITLGVIAFAIILLGVYSFVSRKKIDKTMTDYFAKYYDFSNAYALSGLGVSNLDGGASCKINPEDLTACGLYGDVVKVGSRDLITFTYHDNEIKVVDCAAQTRGPKNSLRTVFVGKMVVAPNDYNGNDLIVYLKGNKRALPPTNLNSYSLLEDHKDYAIYGTKGAKKGLTKKALEAIKSLTTDKTLVDVAVNYRAGHTYFMLGYEDDLMVLPLDNAFNPAPTEHYRADLKIVFSAIDAINGYRD